MTNTYTRQEKSQSSQTPDIKTQDGESSHFDVAAVHTTQLTPPAPVFVPASILTTQCCSSDAQRRNPGVDADGEDDGEGWETLTTILRGERHKLEPREIDVMMRAAFGATILNSDGDIKVTPWYKRWEKIIQLNGRHYNLPGGSIARKYVDLITEETQHPAAGNFPSERLIVCSSVILQRDRMIKKAMDVRRLMERQLSMWKEEKYDLLVQEAERCDRAFKNRSRTKDEEHKIRVFTRLMIQEKVRAAMRWITDGSNNRVLLPTEIVETIDRNGQKSQQTVMEVLKWKHPLPCPLYSTSLLECDHLPLLEEVEITGAHIHSITHSIQGGWIRSWWL